MIKHLLYRNGVSSRITSQNTSNTTSWNTVVTRVTSQNTSNTTSWSTAIYYTTSRTTSITTSWSTAVSRTTSQTTSITTYWTSYWTPSSFVCSDANSVKNTIIGYYKTYCKRCADAVGLDYYYNHDYIGLGQTLPQIQNSIRVGCGGDTLAKIASDWCRTGATFTSYSTCSINTSINTSWTTSWATSTSATTTSALTSWTTSWLAVSSYTATSIVTSYTTNWNTSFSQTTSGLTNWTTSWTTNF